MMKILASLIILSLCANVCFGTTLAAAGTSQGSSFSGLNSTAQKVFVASNTTDATNWDSTVASSTATAPTGIPYSNVIFGPGTTNDTSYVYGYSYTSSSITTIIVRTLNNTIVAYANDTGVEAFTKSESKITPTILASSVKTAVGPGYLALLTYGTDSSSNVQVYYTLVSGTTASPVKITTTADVVAGTSLTAGQFCTTTSFTLGNIWYDIGSAAFFYTYSKKLITQTVGATVSSGTGTCGGTTGQTTVNTIYLGGVYANGTVFMPTPLALTTANPANTPSNIMAGGDNWLNATNIFVAYLDSTVTGTNTAVGAVYYQKITKSASATAGSFTSLVANTVTGTITTGSPNSASTSVVSTNYVPLSVWSSNFTYGIAVSNISQTQTSGQYPSTPGTYTYAITNYLNLTSTMTGTADSGISYSSALGVAGLWGWQLSTGYTLVAGWLSSTTSTPENTYTYTWGTFYGNGTVNASSATLGAVQGPVSFYEDVNGTQWIGWTDVETANSPTLTYAGYLAKLQGQLNVASGANVLATLSALALLFAAILAL